MSHNRTDGSNSVFRAMAGQSYTFTDGLTKREYFAALAMAANLTNPVSVKSALDIGNWKKELAYQAVCCADALIEALNKNDDTE